MSKSKEWCDLAKRLYKKIEAEHEAWLDEICKFPVDVIICKADDIALLRNIVDLIGQNSSFLDEYRLQALLSLENTLLSIQKAWFDCDKNVYREMENTIRHLAEKIFFSNAA